MEQPPARLLLECLRDREDDVLRFLSDLRIPPTSNQAERDVRPAKTQQKISGRLRSEQVTRHRYAVRGYISTAAKHGISVFTALRDALAGNPWMPPITAAPEIRLQAITPRDADERSAQRNLNVNVVKAPGLLLMTQELSYHSPLLGSAMAQAS